MSHIHRHKLDARVRKLQERIGRAPAPYISHCGGSR